MLMRYMLDTNICIYIIKQKPKSVLHMFQEKSEYGICISSITLAELEFGVQHSSNLEKNERSLLQFLLPLQILDFGSKAAYEYGVIREYLQKQGTPIGPLDMLIAAHAKAEDLTLVTNNLKEFERVPSLKTENWVTD